MKNDTIENTVQTLLNGLTAATLSKPGADAEYVKIRIRQIGKNRHFLIEQFTETQSFHRTVTRTEAGAFLIENIGKTYKNTVMETELGSKHIIVHFLTNKKGKTTILRKEHEPQKKAVGSNEQKTVCSADDGSFLPAQEKRSCSSQTDSQCTVQTDNQSTAGFNRVKNYIIQEGKPVPFLIHLGIMTKDGKITAKYYAKFRQINRFLEFIDDVFSRGNEEDKEHSESRAVRVIDFGCGKSYLTFALYYYLHDIRGFDARITGIDLKKDVIDHCTSLAQQLGLNGLSFICGNVSDYNEENKTPPDLVISLHACDTATDYALAYGVSSGAKAVLSVPCCQHELNSSTDRKNSGAYFAAMSKFGIIKERMCALTTDVMRSELLEQAGYSVQILEFIDMEHTPKNLLIRAVRRQPSKPDTDEQLSIGSGSPNSVCPHSITVKNTAAARAAQAFETLCREAGASITLEKLLQKK